FARRVPIRGFMQVVKIIAFIAGGIIILGMIVKRDPTNILAGFGAMTAVLMLIFKDAILGFVAGIQISANNMVHLGDWIEMPKYGADGDVTDISLTTVKVQNWDKTISTIPAYALISDSFKNWRGMSESAGRRIKRSINIDMNTVKFCNPMMLDKFRRIEHIAEYIDAKQAEIDDYNTEANIDNTELVNGRRMTNVGTFRAYVIAYLKNHPKINRNMTFLVRQLKPTECGLPIEIYVFSSDKVWANYEAIQADIFDHILAVIPEFGLRVFQNPTGSDFSRLASSS
ncbi:MAG: mechanosensitive ion channel family protein, partial [Planctomycetota bacterium]